MPDQCKVIQLTDAEKEVVEASGQKAPDKCIYCTPCWRTLTNKATGPSLLKGMHVLRLRALGVPHADKLAEDFIEKVIAKTPKEKPS